MWPCAARSAPPWLWLRRVRAGGGGGEAGGCGRKCGGARGAHGRRALRSSSALPPAGPASQPHAALFLWLVVASSPGRCPRSRALCLSQLPPATLYPRPFVSPPWALCPTHRALHPFSISSLRLSFLPCPFVVPLSIRQLSDLPQPRHQISLFSVFIYYFSHVLLSPFCVVFDHPNRLCLSHPVAYSLGTPVPLPSIDLSIPHSVCRLNCPSPGDSIWCLYVQADPRLVFVGLRDAWGYLLSCSALLLSAPFSLGILCTPPPHFSRDYSVSSFLRLSLGPWLFCLETVTLEKDRVSWLLPLRLLVSGGLGQGQLSW